MSLFESNGKYTMSLSEPKEPRSARKHNLVKIGIGLIIAVIVLIFSSILSETNVDNTAISTALFLIDVSFKDD